MTIETGTIISGTLREEDLIPAFIDALSALNEERSLEWRKHFPNEIVAVRAFSTIDDRLAYIEQRMRDESYWLSDDAQWDMEWLIGQLNFFAPEGTYFGSHPGDGADFGFWECE